MTVGAVGMQLAVPPSLPITTTTTTTTTSPTVFPSPSPIPSQFVTPVSNKQILALMKFVPACYCELVTGWFLVVADWFSDCVCVETTSSFIVITAYFFASLRLMGKTKIVCLVELLR